MIRIGLPPGAEGAGRLASSARQAGPSATQDFEGFDAKAPDGQGVDTRAKGQARRPEAPPAAGLEVAGLDLY